MDKYLHSVRLFPRPLPLYIQVMPIGAEQQQPVRPALAAWSNCFHVFEWNPISLKKLLTNPCERFLNTRFFTHTFTQSLYASTVVSPQSHEESPSNAGIFPGSCRSRNMWLTDYGALVHDPPFLQLSLHHPHSFLLGVGFHSSSARMMIIFSSIWPRASCTSSALNAKSAT